MASSTIVAKVVKAVQVAVIVGGIAVVAGCASTGNSCGKSSCGSSHNACKGRASCKAGNSCGKS